MEVYIDDIVVKSLRADDHLKFLQETFNILRKYNVKLNLEKYAFGIGSGKFLEFMVSNREIEINPDKIKEIEDITVINDIKGVQRLTGRIAAVSRFISRSSDRSRRFFSLLKKTTDFAWTPECQMALGELKRSADLTNNEAEYEAMIAGLELVKSLGAEIVEAKCDSLLVVNLTNGTFEIKDHRMQRYQEKLQVVLRRFKEWTLEHLTKSVIETGRAEINSTSLTWDWRNKYIDYLQTGKLPSDAKESRALRTKAARFCLVNSQLYRRSFHGLLARCLGPGETDYVLREVHEWTCGNHSGADSLVRKLIRARYYWNGMKEDAKTFVRKCNECQRHAPSISIRGRAPSGPLTMAIHEIGHGYSGTFAMGPRVPAKIAYDNGKQFIGSKVSKFFEEYKIKKILSTPYHLSANGQAESTNKTILQNLKKRLAGSKHRWKEVLPEVLWAYRITVRSSTGETPFSLAYGAEALIPVGVGEPSLRFRYATEDSNHEAMSINLNLVDERREAAYIRIAAQKQMMQRYYNWRTNLKHFQIGDLVLRKVIFHTKNPYEGKLAPNWEGPYRVTGIIRKGSCQLENEDGQQLKNNWNVAHLKRYYC
ncbi:uncharacterized protein LOC132634403 [Lycium barbarum]|uniref:uncharacterized protein LOC132634403 n=1 Tax=Lycium barbarum TaxID=112863 RepID=UPI00293F6577|nr:uncharacterized protein LOC132634403 [Lycium barbarum]